eukprot:TRINITY_DN1461_c0_g2_i1.p1 TRINITY_DN1461_c0_g2~~TRINITY_DN1461_c0_g2_i1.p1  ORF type:complete len:212 (+),score=28.16 TRINITY_DN1461_c0_g2_i1:497-1132(+)
MGVCTTLPNLAIITEFVEKGSLWDHLRKIQCAGFTTVEKPLSMAKDAARGMNYLHQRKPPILHRDLKSPNLLVDASGSLKVCDFGFTVVKGAANSHTQCGTVAYMAPEMLRHEEYDEKVDVYSFGIVLWELYTGGIPYEGLSNQMIYSQVVHNGSRPPLPPHLAIVLKNLIGDCWHPQPSRRPCFTVILQRLEEIEFHRNNHHQNGLQRRH